MNVASLELCKELYELSGWDDAEWRLIPDKDTRLGCRRVPAYPIGYLIQKFPRRKRLEIKEMNNGHWVCQLKYDYRYKEATVSGRVATLAGTHEYAAHEDTPEDAVCKLAIELFKQGILTKETTL
jgi:hypothetical protein